ncbi:ubiquitin-like small modifier protein 1 [Halococcus hamelinensis]|uniref:Sulfur carrier protein ThiS n=1 Tax=Halococcus hamelinensis 100A6 TaxID=1132509 RepID=M0LT86_9EURY|nr:ubiquitin-like small modifier protein 1 [Halococcus hamelinensis]EMA36641.1 sulfur carrier protein ThiS [Halococcus hamelinensis 100A6]
MHWKLFATLAETAGEREVPVSVEPNATLADALAALFERHPALETEIVEDGTVRDHINLLRNGEDPFADGDGLDTRLDEGDELAAFPPVTGG